MYEPITGDEPEKKELSVKDALNRLNENMEKFIASKENKKFRFPRSGKVSKSKVKKNYVSICYINENREVKFTKAPVKEGGYILDGSPHLATPDYMLTYRGKPFIIQPGWSIKPYSPEESYDQAVRDKNTNTGYRNMLNLLLNQIYKTKKNISVGLIIFGLLIAAGAAYYFFVG